MASKPRILSKMDRASKLPIYHGGKGGNSTFVKFGLTESIVRVEGYSKLVPPKSYMTMLIFYTRDSSGHIHQYGPVGSGIPAYLSLFNFAGVVIGLYGESGQYLNGLGFEYDISESPNVLPFYKKTPLTGGRGGTPFDDALPTLNPLQIKHMTIHFGQYINGISTTYLLRNGSLTVKEHGTLDICPENNIGILNTQVVYIDFADDERITLIVVAHSYEPKNRVNFLKFFTWGSKGVMNEYGPYGSGQDVPGNNSATFEGVVNGFYGRSGKVIDALGFYI